MFSMQEREDFPFSDKKPTASGVREVFSGCSDLTEREIRTPVGTACVFFIDGLTGGETIAREVIAPLTDAARFSAFNAKKPLCGVLEGAVFAASAKERDTLGEVVSDLLSGFCAVIFEGARGALTFEAKSPEKRGVDAPREEKVVKGAKDAFVETLRTNTALVRRKLRSPALKITEITAGRETRTRTAVFYIEGFTNEKLVSEALRRLSGMRAGAVLTAAALEECLSDSPKTPFPQLLSTERPDRFCLNLLEGRVGIIADGLPLGYLAPGTFAQFFKVPEDAANHFVVGTVLTVMRYLALILSLVLPAFFVAAAMYHQEMIPTKLLQAMIDAKQSVPFSAPMEVFLMLAAFELLQEAGLRLPAPVGETVSIIGALIVGQSAVEARIVSPVVVIVVALAGVAGYTTPNQDMASAVRLCRFLLTAAAVAAGMYGVAAACLLLMYHLCTLESFGVPYMTPFVGTDAGELVGAFIRRPLRGGTHERALKAEKRRDGK